jgi:hypothetical protein
LSRAKEESSDPELIARRELRQKLSNVLQELGVSSVDGVKDLFKEMIGAVLENGLEGELDDKLGCSKYDCRNKATDNSRNGYSGKALRSSCNLRSQWFFVHSTLCYLLNSVYNL